MAARAWALVFLLGTFAARAAADPICAARPGKSTPACTVPAGHFQLETGLADWSLQKASGERDTSLVIGETTFKYGLTDRSDIEVDVTPWQRSTSRGPGFRERASGNRRRDGRLQAPADGADGGGADCALART